jgi:two-component system, LytTR family, response regulator LytT
MNVLIVEDESLARERLAELIQRYDPDIRIVGQLDSIEETVEFFTASRNVDLAFLDIQLSDGLSFEIFNRVQMEQPVIFTTAYDHYALKAFKVNSVDYLLKPIDYRELSQAIEKYKRLQSPERTAPMNRAMIREIFKELNKRYKKRFIVKYGDHIQFKSAEEVAYIFAEGKTVYMVCAGNQRRYVIDHTLDELEQHLVDPEQFFRINRKFIVRIDCIRDVRSYANSRLRLYVDPPCEQDMIVSREKVAEFKLWLNQ